MFKKLINSLKKERAAVTPTQGKRLTLDREEESPDGGASFTIHGQKLPGFFIIFGLMFGGIPLIILTGLLFGTAEPDPEKDTLPTIFGLLFLIPFLAVGAGTFLAGLFLWLGKTRIHCSSRSVAVTRSLFGRDFKKREFPQSTLTLEFTESHKTNGVPSYKLAFQDTETGSKIGVGGSLKEPELLWLEREVRQALGRDIKEHHSALNAIISEEVDLIEDAEIDPDYHSKKLSFTKTTTGWEAKTRTSVIGAISLALFGSIFLLVGLLMADRSRELIFDLIPALRDLASGFGPSSGDGPPWLFPIVFGGVGALVMLSSILSLGYRVTIAKRHSRLHLERRWTFFVMSDAKQLSDLQELETKQKGHVNDVPRFSLIAHFKNGEKLKIFSFATAEDIGQVHARLQKEIRSDVSSS